MRILRANILLGAASALTIAWVAVSGHVGPNVRLAFVAAAIAAFALTVKNADGLAFGCVFVATALVLAFAVMAEPRDSRDIWSYAMHGSMVANHDASPYKHQPDQFPDDPLLQEIPQGWRHVRSPYGPLFTGFSATAVAVAGDSRTLTRMMFQGSAALVVLLGLVILRRSDGGVRSCVLLGLSPATVAIVNSGHNDLYVGVLVLGAVVLARRRHWGFVGAALACAVLIKAYAALPALAVLWWMWRNRARRAAIQCAVLTTALAAGAYIPVGGIEALRPIIDVGNGASRASLWAAPRHLLTPQLVSVASLLIVAAVAWFLGRKWVRDDDPAIVTTGITAAALFAASYLLPWYPGVVLPAAAASAPSAPSFAANVQALALVVAYTVSPGQPASGLAAVLSVVALPAALGLIAYRYFVSRRSALSSSTADAAR